MPRGLVVDGEQGFVSGLQEFLPLTNYEVSTVAGGREALWQVRAARTLEPATTARSRET